MQLITASVLAAACGAGLGALTRPKADASSATAMAGASEARSTVATAGSTEEDFARRVAAVGYLPRLALQKLFTEWFEREPDLFPRFLKLEQEHPGRVGDLTAAFFTAWAWRDCTAASHAVKTSALVDRAAAVAAVWKVACATGNAAASSLAVGSSIADWSPLERLARRDPAAALALTTQDTSSRERSRLALVRGWAAVDGAAAAAWASALPDDAGGAVFRTACLSWERTRPGALQGANGSLRQRLEADPVLSRWIGAARHGAEAPPAAHEACVAAEVNPFATWEDVLAEMRRSADAKTPAAKLTPWPTRTGEWSPADPAAALTQVLATPETSERQRLIEAIRARWESYDAEAAAVFAETHGLPPRSEAFAKAAMSHESTFEEAIAAAAPAGEVRDWNALSAAVSRQMREDPARAVAFLQEHRDRMAAAGGDTWGLITGSAVAEWSQSDVNAAMEWVATLPTGAMRDQAVGGALQALSRYDPQAALTWMATMEHPRSGSRSPESIAGDLRRRLGPHGARRAVEASSLPADLKEEMLSTPH